MTTERLSIIPPTGNFDTNWPANFNIPQGASGYISAAGWTYGNEGFIQQTFLGASIRNFSINAEFGNSSSTLSVNLVEDEYNRSDKTGAGIGDDVYHSGIKDNFVPPAVGSPVFFKFGKTFATIEQAWRPIFDSIYKYDTLDDDDIPSRSTSSQFPIPLEEGKYIDLKETDRKLNKYEIVNQPTLISSGYTGDTYDPTNNTARGKKHIIFGGILQSYVETKGSDGNPLYSAQVVDPREILSNTVVILNNYAGSVFNNKNYFNVYGFLEYDTSDNLKNQFESLAIPGFNLGSIESSGNWITNGIDAKGNFLGGWAATKSNNVLEKIVDQTNGAIYYVGNDMYRFTPASAFSSTMLPEFFPMTGQGFARRSEKGMPWYRVRQGLNALFNYNGALPQEYIDKGFGGPINFRGYNYVVDFTGIPIEKIPQMYFMDFDQIDLLSLCQELCDVISHDLFVTLLPVINHPASKFLFDWNSYYSDSDNNDPNPSSKIIAGIIRVDAINRSDPPRIGAIKTYLDSLTARNIEITSQDLGYELSNITTDKIVAGAQEIDMYFFSGNKIRDNLQFRKFRAGQANSYETLQTEQWSLETSLKQQILPFYGFLGKDCPTIPIGFGSFQQILLDSSAVDAYGVGNYYVATEMELRAALVSYEEWSQFLASYNELYVEELTEDRVFWRSLGGVTPSGYSREFGVSVPRCVFVSERNGVDANGYPLSPCSPPYGYPLYYKRAEKIGVPQAGILKIAGQLNQVMSNLEIANEIASQRDELMTSQGQGFGGLNNWNANVVNAQLTLETNKQYMAIQNDLQEIQKKLAQAENAQNEAVAIRKILKANEGFIRNISSLASSSSKNAKKVYDFVRGIAEKHLGKTFLVKVPTTCNLNYSKQIQIEDGFLQVNNITSGPYGFKPIPINSDISQLGQDISIQTGALQARALDPTSTFEHYLNFNLIPTNTGLASKPIVPYTYGALKSNFSPVSDNWEFNYKPESAGGFFSYNLFDRNISFSQLNTLDPSKIPFIQSQLLAPMDLTNFQTNAKIKPYVRFDHSEHLDFSSIGKQNLAQQIITSNGFIPDILEDLNNVNIDSNESFDQIQRRLSYQNKPPSVAFVSCEVDEQLYLIPKLNYVQTRVYAQNVRFKNVTPTPSVKKINISGCIDYVIEQEMPYPIFIIPNNGGPGETVNRLDFVRYYDSAIDSNVILTEKQLLNNQHVYAVITLPDRVTPTIDQRYLDGPYQVRNGASIKHVLTSDVVRGAPGFDTPAPFMNPATYQPDCNQFSLSGIDAANRAQREIWAGIGFANPEIKIGFAQPSPVYPDLVALPLMSMERCYGPWISSSIFNGQTNNGVRYSDIGGKVEFVKDENLAPWNFDGYQLMNEAGALQAQFSNSLLLFSERGGFTIPELPEGIVLARPLTGRDGPLVTSISVDVSENSVQTTIKMDLYTARFGKLQKQKEIAIGQITRERQKITDRNNLMARRGILKGAALSRSFDLGTITSSNPISNLATRGITHIVADANGATFATKENITNILEALADSNYALKASRISQAAGTPITNMFTAASEQPHPNMSSAQPTFGSNNVIRYRNR